MRWLSALCLLLPLSTCLADEPGGLIFYAGFDEPVMRCGGWAGEMPSWQKVSGRFAGGCRMERPRTNLLSADQASADGSLEGFVAGPDVKLASVAIKGADKAVQATAAAAGALWTLTPREVKLKGPHRPTITVVLSAYLRSPQPGAKVRLTLRDALEEGDWRQTVEKANQDALAKDPQAKVKDPFTTVSQPGELVLTGQWQRVMALLEIDSRRPAQTLVGSLELLDGAPATVQADRLQLEQAALYPVPNTAPTTWHPGGERIPASWMNFEAGKCNFTGEAGTLSCWVRPVPDECGGTRPVGAIMAVGTGWFAPIWSIGNNMWYAGNGNAVKYQKSRMSVGDLEKRLAEPGDNGGWHHLALVWDGTEAVGYCDGVRAGRCDFEPGRIASGTMIRLGGNFLEQHPMTGDLDEVSIYNRRLSEQEVAQLAQRDRPLQAELPATPLARPLRLTFLRSQAEAAIPLAPAGNAAIMLKAEAPAFGASVSGKATADKPLMLKFKPWLMEPGAYPLRVMVADGNTQTVLKDQIEIFEEPQGRFIIYGWGGTDDLEQIGLNSAVVGSAGAQRELLERGLWANSRIDIRDAVPYPWSPWNRQRAESIARATARAFIANPNVWSCLVNSEMGDPPFPKPEDEPWFFEWMKQETGLTEIPPQIVRSPVHAIPDKHNPTPAVMGEEYPPYRFLEWWGERGMGWWLFGNQLARCMKEEGLDVIYYSDQPEAVLQFADMDMVDYWHYPKVPEGLVARFSHASNMARLLGKRFEPMPGTVYWDDGNGLWVMDDDGKRKVLGLSQDCLRENLWLSVACPSDSVGIYGLGERKTEIYDRGCDQVMAETYGLIQPVGTLVGGLPIEQPQVAMLEHAGLDFTQPDIADEWIHHWTVRNTGRILARARLPFDWITEAHVEAGWLKRYRAVVVPGAWALPEKTHRALVEFAKQGGQVVADQTLRAEIPGVQRVAIKTQADPQETQDREWGGWARRTREQVAGFAQVDPADRVFTYTREAGPARYLFIINDHREAGPQYERFKIEQMPADGGGPLRDRGLPQDVTVTVPAGMALYDVLGHEAIEARADGNKQQFRLSLKPGAAAVIALLPQPVARLAVSLPAALKPGTEALLKVRVLDRSGKPIEGRQLVELKVTTPQGEWKGVQRYTRVENGSLDLPLRVPLTAGGQWQVEVREWLSGQQAQKVCEVK